MTVPVMPRNKLAQIAPLLPEILAAASATGKGYQSVYLADGGGLPDVRYFEVDIDKHATLARRWEIRSIPLLLFFHGGRRLRLETRSGRNPGGACVGGIGQRELAGICGAVLEAAPRGEL